MKLFKLTRIDEVYYGQYIELAIVAKNAQRAIEMATEEHGTAYKWKATEIHLDKEQHVVAAYIE